MDKHAFLSASASSRWLACPPSAKQCAELEDQSSPYAQQGTDAHELCEYLVTKALGRDASDPTPHLSFYDAEMQEAADGYCGFVMEQVAAAKEHCSDPLVCVEQRLDFSRWVKDGFGTGDCVIVADDLLHIIDLKYGVGVLVTASGEDGTGNSQLKCYALGALDTFGDLYDIRRIRLSIYQPRRDNVDTFEMSADELLKWADEVLKPTAELAYEGGGEFHAGDHCQFCKLKATCRARAEYSMELAKYDFADAPTLDSTEIAAILPQIDSLVSWADDIKAYALEQALSGVRYPHFKLVEGSAMLSDGISTAEIGLRDSYREFYMNFVSLSGGETWKANRLVGSFQLEVIGTSGVSKITNQDYLVSTADGRDVYAAECRDVTVILSTECSVNFQTNGGSEISAIKGQYGETIARPDNPVREGYHLVGWYTDIDLQIPWDFDVDTLQGNMTLYAKWADGDPVVPGEDNEISVVMLLLIALLSALFGWLLWLFLLWKRKQVKYSLITGDVSLDYKNGDVPVEVTVVLYDGEKEYHLNKSGIVDVKHRLKFIKNVTSIPVAVIEPGTYKGKLLIHEGNKIRVRKCWIQALDKELEEM